MVARYTKHLEAVRTRALWEPELALKPFAMTLGSWLKKARIAAGLSLRDVEREKQISNSYLSQLESDLVKTPSPRHLYALSELYGLAYADAMRLAGYRVPDVMQGPSTPTDLSFRDGYLTPDEERQVAVYAEFLRALRG